MFAQGHEVQSIVKYSSVDTSYAGEAGLDDKCLTAELNLQPSLLQMFLYEVNGWIGGPADRVLVVKSLAGYQPSFDGIWSKILCRHENQIDCPFSLKFDTHAYQNLDQVSENRDQQNETQLLLGCLALSIVGDCNCHLFSNECDNRIEIFEDQLLWLSRRAGDIEMASQICRTYGVPFRPPDK